MSRAGREDLCMLPCFAPAGTAGKPVRVVTSAGYAAWLAEAPAPVRTWLEGTGFKAKGGAVALLPAADGTVASALLETSDPP